jgi:hypothetical protein
MSRFAVSWIEDGRPYAMDLEPVAGRAIVIGRDSAADLVVPLKTVSRRQARLSWDGARFVFENLSNTNPSRIDGAPVAGHAALAEGTRIDAGGAVLRFHDLAAGDRVSGPVCSHCSRENRSGDPECWFCGTSLVNAVTSVRRKRRVELRLVGETGDVTDLLDGMALVLRPGGEWDAVATDPAPGPRRAAPVAVDASPAVTIEGRRPTVVDDTSVRVEAADSASESGGDRSEAGSRLSTGDRLIVADRQFVSIVREASRSDA